MIRRSSLSSTANFIRFTEIIRKTLDKTENCFRYLNVLLSHLSSGKIKEGIFVGLDKRRLIKYKNFEKKNKSFKKDAWTSLEDVTKQFLRN